ncbi:sarcosine oxidase subunit delta [Leptospira interrogans]
MLIPCPYCGERPHNEFTYGGDASLVRPTDPTSATDQQWYAYVYLRDNCMGAHREHWHHTLGCSQWIELRRDTLTHRIEGAVPVGGDRA